MEGLFMNLTLQELPIAKQSRLSRSDTKLLVIDYDNYITSFGKINDLVDFLEPGDVVVVNNSGTLPASFQGMHVPSQQPIELRLAYNLSSDQKSMSNWMGLVFGEGDWKIPTENRPIPPLLQHNDIIMLGPFLQARVIGIHSEQQVNGAVLVEIKFLGKNHKLWQRLYQHGQPIQYSYLNYELELWDQQTIFSGPPVSVEAPSASFQLSWELMFQLEAKGVEVIPITHAISISSTGNDILDRSLPFPERYWISEHAADRINHTVRRGGQVVAFGTSITRALENSATENGGMVIPGSFIAKLRLDERYKRKIVSGILTGMHVPDESHIELLKSFVPISVIEQSYKEALQMNYLWHEYGDVSLILSEI
jgi:S-adenosylmethionine:tRNA ribosyltransferase-isomerase